jgi:hypothetical protein
MAKRIHYASTEMPEPPCGLSKVGVKESFTITTTDDKSRITCYTCLIKLGLIDRSVTIQAPVQSEVPLPPAAIEPTNKAKLFDLQSLIGLTIQKAFTACRGSGYRFVRLTAEDGEQYDMQPNTTRTDRINLEAIDNIVVKVYIK